MHELESWLLEKRSAHLYRALSDAESGNPKQLMFLELAREADEQAKLWMLELRKNGEAAPEKYVPDKRSKFLAWLMQKLPPRHLKSRLVKMNLRGLAVYSKPILLPHPIPAVVQQLAAKRNIDPHSLRAAAFAAYDGLFFITLLVLGVTGASHQFGIILLTGVLGLLIGALVVAVSEYFAINAQRKNFAHFEPDAQVQYPQAVVSELALIYQARGMTVQQATALALRMVTDPDIGVDVVAQEMPAINPKQLGLPGQAALFSFFAFIVAGLLPLLPYVLSLQRHPVMICVVMSSMGLFLAGAVMAIFTGKQPLWNGFRTLGIGVLAGLTSYYTGAFIGSRMI